MPISKPLLNQAAEIVKSGGLLAYPTEAVYGLGCDPGNREAVERLLQLKSRPVNKGLILIAANFEQLQPYLQPLSDVVMARLQASWPGPNTWVVPATATAPAWVRGRFDSLAVRVTAHPIAAALCRACGPLISTSANPAGSEPARDAAQVSAYFGEQIELIVPGAVGELSQPTPIRDALSGASLRN